MYNANKKPKPVVNKVKTQKLVSKKSSGKGKKEKKTSKKGKEKYSSTSSGGGIFGPRALQVYGVLLMLFAVLLLVSLVSYFFHHEADLSHVSGHITPENVAGTVGAHLAYFFVDCCMGIFSIGFAFLFFLYGIRLTFSKTPLPLFSTTVTTLLTMAWLSLTLGVFVYSSDKEFLAGNFGTYFSNLLISATGRWVAILILIALLLILLILCYNFSMSYFLKLRLPKRAQSDANDANGVVDNQNKKKRKRWFGRDEEEEEDVKFEPQTEDTKLSDLYITNQNGLSDEYRGNVFHFEPTEKEDEHEEEKVQDDGFAELLSHKKEQKKFDEVPFEVKMGGSEKTADELFPGEEEEALESTDAENENPENAEAQKIKQEDPIP